MPNWKDESKYPKKESTGLAQWKWEFLRRREDYQQDWLTYGPQAYAQEMKEYEEQPFSEISVGTKILRTQKARPLPPDHPDCTVEMPGCVEKYGVRWLINPNNPQPENLWVFPLACPLFDDLTSPGEGVMMDVFGLQMVLLKHEVGVLFDLLRAPIENQLAVIEGEFPMEFYEHDGPNGTLVHKNFQSYLLHPSGLKLEELTVSRKPHKPRIIVHPQAKKGGFKGYRYF